MSAKSSTLGSLHELFAQYWMDRMTKTSPVYDAEGDVAGETVVPLSAAEAAVLRAFLKDNNVQADPADDADVKVLAKNLRHATEGTVSNAELDAILRDFSNVSGVMQ